ncbi:MAG: pyridoxine 5'-phosphate synthase, partial [Opitutales bacterium]|nr:pyridoxine 5'-phosphate synthase [Opitutales bacterium]
MKNPIKLGVNIDHCATLRQARYKEVPRGSPIVVEPNIVETARLAELGGADSITAHLREDRRHMSDADLFALRECVKTKLNMEMACASGVLEVALRVRPDYACLVPENRMEITTEGGLDAVLNMQKVSETVAALSEIGVVCSLFIDPDFRQIDAAKQIGAPMVELHTGA